MKPTMSTNTEFFDAALWGNTESVQILLDEGADPNIKSSSGMTALMIAAERNYLDMAKLLLGKGADANAKNQDGVTALMFAIWKSNYEIARLLLEKGADVTSETKTGLTVLRIEIAKPAPDRLILRALLIRGAGKNQARLMPTDAIRVGSVSKGANYDYCVVCGRQVEITANTKLIHLVEGGYYAGLPGESCYRLGDSTLQPIGPDCLRKYSDLELCAHERNECIFYKKRYHGAKTRV